MHTINILIILFLQGTTKIKVVFCIITRRIIQRDHGRDETLVIHNNIQPMPMEKIIASGILNDKTPA